MDCKWVFVIGIIILNIYKVKNDVVGLESPVNTDNKLEMKNNKVKERHGTSLFPKITKKFVVTLAPPRSVFQVSTKKRLLPQFVLKPRGSNLPIGTKFVITRQPIMKKRKFIIMPRTLKLNSSNTNTNNSISFSDHHEPQVNSNINENTTTTTPVHDKDSSEEHTTEDNKTQKDTSKESIEVFQTDTFEVFAKDNPRLSNLKQDTKTLKPSIDEEFDESNEVNTLSTIFLEENDDNEMSNKTNAVKNNIVFNETKETLDKIAVTINNNDYKAEEDADRNEFLFSGSHIRNKKTFTNKNIDDATTKRTKSRLERSINVIEEEHLVTASSIFQSTGRDSLSDLNNIYKNIHT